MTCIETKFIGPTNTRGSRISATALSTKQRIVIDWDQSVNSDQNHKVACLRLAVKFGWIHGDWVMGAGSNGSQIFVCNDRTASVIEMSYIREVSSKAV